MSYPAKVLRQAAASAHYLCYMINATKTQKSWINMHWLMDSILLSPGPNVSVLLSQPGDLVRPGRYFLSCFAESHKIHKIFGKEGSHRFTTFDKIISKTISDATPVNNELSQPKLKKYHCFELLFLCIFL